MASRNLKWITAGLELILAIPLIGGTIVMGSAYVALGIMLALHVITLVVASQSGTGKAGSILGILTSALAWIPLVGWILHLLTCIFLLVDLARNKA